MTDTPTVEVTSGAKRAITIVTLALCWLLIGWVVWKGDPANSLHQSALSWAFAVQIGVLAGIGFGSIVDYLPYFEKGK